MGRHLLAAVAAAGLLLAAASAPGEARGRSWGASYIPNLPVVTQDGETLRFYDDLIKDKVVVVSFIYTSCADLCPLTTAKLADLRDRLGDAFGRDIFFVSLTVDPERDTPERMKAFADAFGAGDGPGWRFVTGNPDDMRLIDARFGDKSAERGLAVHRNEIVIGNGTTGDWTRNSLFGDLDGVARDIRSMDPKWRDEPRPTSAADAGDRLLAIRDRPGEILFRKLCSSCHTVGAGDRVGPDLRGVAERREPAWLMRFLVDPPAMRRSGDATVAALVARFPAVRMPRLGLADTDAGDLVDYLRSETTRLAAGPPSR